MIHRILGTIYALLTLVSVCMGAYYVTHEFWLLATLQFLLAFLQSFLTCEYWRYVGAHNF